MFFSWLGIGEKWARQWPVRTVGAKTREEEVLTGGNRKTEPYQPILLTADFAMAQIAERQAGYFDVRKRRERPASDEPRKCGKTDGRRRMFCAGPCRFAVCAVSYDGSTRTPAGAR